MTDQFSEYIKRDPGDLIAAEDWNDMQKKVKEDIANQVQAAKDDVLHGSTPVDHAVNADQFDQKTPQNWIDYLDQRYAPRVHEHEGQLNYQRYFLELETLIAGIGGAAAELQPAVLTHGMHRHPLVEIYVLQDLVINDESGTPIPRGPFRLAFAGPEHAADPEASTFVTKSWDEVHWGDPINIVKDSLAANMNEAEQKSFLAQFQENFTLGSWLTNLERQLFEPGPAQFHFDVGSIYRTGWVRERLPKKISQLKDDGDWPPRLVHRPLLLNPSGGLTPQDDNVLRVDVFHISVDQIELQAHADQPVRLLVLLRA